MGTIGQHLFKYITTQKRPVVGMDQRLEKKINAYVALEAGFFFVANNR